VIDFSIPNINQLNGSYVWKLRKVYIPYKSLCFPYVKFFKSVKSFRLSLQFSILKIFSNSNFVEWAYRSSYSTFYNIWLRQIESNSANDLVNTQYRIYVYRSGVYKDIIRFSTFFQKNPFIYLSSTQKLENRDKLGYTKFDMYNFYNNSDGMLGYPRHLKCNFRLPLSSL